MTKYAVLDYGDKKVELKNAMGNRLGRIIYVPEVYDSKTTAILNRGTKMAPKEMSRYRKPIGILEDVELLPSAYYKGRLVSVEY